MANSNAVYQCKEIQLVYDAPNGAAVTIFTDFPANLEAGGGLNGQALGFVQITLPATVGRGTSTQKLDQNGAAGNYLEGTLFKIEMTSTGVIRLYSGKLRVRKIGTYILPGHSYRTQEIALG